MLRHTLSPLPRFDVCSDYHAACTHLEQEHGRPSESIAWPWATTTFETYAAELEEQHLEAHFESGVEGHAHADQLRVLRSVEP